MREGDTLSFILANQLGSATVTLDSTGNVQSELRYHPFGETRHSDGTTPTNRRFTGQIQDEGTGLYYYNARYYDPSIGRFIQADTIVPEPGNPQSLNRYSYVLNNPLKYTDPTGHFTYAAVGAYLNETYRNSSGQVFGQWYNDKSWAQMIGNAQGGDTVALVNSDGSTSWYYFDGNGHDELNGIYEVSGPGGLLAPGASPMSGGAVEGARGNYALIGGLFKQSNNSITLRWHPRRHQQGKNGYSGTVQVNTHTVTEAGYYTGKGGAIVAGGAAGSATGAGIGFIAAGPVGATVGGGLGFVGGAIAGSVTETRFTPPPIGSATITLTVDLYGPGQTYDWYYGQYTITSLGVPIEEGGYTWSRNVVGPCSSSMPCTFR